MLKHRYRRILWFFALLILRLIWWDVILPSIGLARTSRRTRPERLRQAARSFRTLAVSMGGVLIKVGQFLSSRLDVLPSDVTDELAGLQDEVPAEPFENVRAVVESEFSAPLAEKFSEFDPAPLASASIGQVHRARLRTAPGLPEDQVPPPVVVKVQRPNIQAIVETDLSALRVVGGWIMRYPPIRKRANVPALLDEFTRSLHEEIDYLVEGKNAETFAANFAGDPEVRVPRVFWDHTTRRVLTLEDVWAIKIADRASIERVGISPSEVADRLFRTYLKQIFEDHFFHADPHPGNLFVFPTGQAGEDGRAAWKLVFVDFGMTGRITPQLQAGLREAVIAVGTRDARRMVRAFQTLGVLLPGADVGQLEKAAAQAFDRFWGKTAPEMMRMHGEEARQFAREFSDLLYEMPFQVPENLILLGRCVGILSGMCTGLDPEFNVWTRLAPYARELVEDEAGGSWQLWLGEIGNYVRMLVGLPVKVDALLDILQQGRIEARVPEMTSLILRLERTVRRMIGAILAAALLLAAIQVFRDDRVVLTAILVTGVVVLVVWIFTGI